MGGVVSARHFQTFLSYNSTDHMAVEQIAQNLHRQGIELWLDTWNLIPGNAWQAEIERALEDCGTCSVLIGPSGLGPWQHAEMRAAIDRQISKGDFRVIPVLLPGAERGERSRYPTFLTQTTWIEFRSSIDEQEPIRRLMAGIRGIPPGPTLGLLSTVAVCPYRGLEPFDVEHSRFFFGRDALIEWLLAGLHVKREEGKAIRFLAVVGASGSGKSSLVRAGLIPAINRGAIPDSENWPVLILRPGPTPHESLAVALKRDPVIGKTAGDVGDLKLRLRESTERLHLTVRLALSGQPGQRRVVVVVDQLEEVFTLCKDPDVRKAFIDGLIYAATETSGQIVVIVTIRADFYAKCAPYERLAAAMSDHHMLVGPMPDHDLREAVLRPARLTGFELDPGLVEMLIEDTRGKAGGLPLLEYTLAQLWERRTAGRLTVAAYTDIGGLAGALEKQANKIYDSFTPSEKQACEQIFLRLTQPGEGTEDTKRRAYRDEMGSNEDIERVLRALTEARLITTKGEEGQAEPLIEVSHEALIRGWPKLRRWIDANRDALRFHLRLTEAAREWGRRKGRSALDHLYRGSVLGEAEEWTGKAYMDLSDLERKFLEASVALRDQELSESRRKRRRRFALSSAVMGIIGVLIGSGVFQYMQAQRSKARLAETLATQKKEAQRTDLSGALTVFATSYGRGAQEFNGRGLFTLQLEKYLFRDYISVTHSVSLAEPDVLSNSQESQRPEVLSSTNGEIFFNPHNDTRRSLALVVGSNDYDPTYSHLQGAVADAQSIASGVRNAGFASRFLANPSTDDVRNALDQLLKDATQDCNIQKTHVTTPELKRSLTLLEEIKPCTNVLVFVYFAGHGFSSGGNTYLVMRDTDVKALSDVSTGKSPLSVEEIRGRIAERVAAQIIIADVSRTLLRR
jgi:hypothetical protein